MMRARLLILVLFMLASPGIPSAHADVISLKRGVSLDLWVTWPSEDEMLKPGMLEPFPEWRKSVPITVIAGLKSAGFDFVRLTLEPAPFLNGEDALRKHLIAQSVETIRAITETGLKVIVDLHAIPREGGRAGTDQIVGQQAMFERHVALVEKMGKAIAGFDAGMVAFELLNEPNVTRLVHAIEAAARRSAKGGARSDADPFRRMLGRRFWPQCHRPKNDCGR
jgi:endoglucanase